MDATRFDRWTQTLTTTISRRQTLRGLLLCASPLATALALTQSQGITEAKKILAAGEMHGQRSALHHASSPINGVACLHVDLATAVDPLCARHLSTS